MEVFISWSGEKSLAYAGAIKELIINCIQSIKVFCSSEDIYNGDNWTSVLLNQLSTSRYGIVCLTKDNINSSWLNFEAGAIASKLDNKVTAVLIDMSNSDMSFPLSLFQSTGIEKKSMLNMLIAINNTLDVPIEKDRIAAAFEMFFPKFMDSIGEFKFSNPISSNDSTKLIKQILSIVQDNENMLRRIEECMPSIIEQVDRIEKTDYKAKYDILYDKIFVFLYSISTMDDKIYQNISERYVLNSIMVWVEDCFKKDKYLKKHCGHSYDKIRDKCSTYSYSKTK